jgi:hypothetical protein
MRILTSLGRRWSFIPTFIGPVCDKNHVVAKLWHGYYNVILQILLILIISLDSGLGLNVFTLLVS